MGIEPTLSAWKAEVLPLNYSRTVAERNLQRAATPGGGRWIRTTEGVSQQIYSLPPLATWVTYHEGAQIKPKPPANVNATTRP